MSAKLPLFLALILATVAMTGTAQESAKPAELELLASYVGVWDAEIEVWPAGPGSPSTKFKGVETNRLYGEHWIASDFDSEFAGQTMKVHSIVGYDLDKKRLVATVIDHGPYAASMSGDYDPESKKVTWMTKVKDPSGKLIIQKTVITHPAADERRLVLSVPNKETGDFTEFMQIKYVKRK